MSVAHGTGPQDSKSKQQTLKCEAASNRRVNEITSRDCIKIIAEPRCGERKLYTNSQLLTELD